MTRIDLLKGAQDRQSCTLLTIAVPTYNRARTLDRLLHSLAPQLAGEMRVELLVSDNASHDETQAVLAKHRGRGLSFRSIRNANNLGADGNFMQCYERAWGRYLWIVGDDDLVAPGAVAAIVNLLAEATLSGKPLDLVHLRGRDIIENQPLQIVPNPPRMKVISDARTFTLRTHVWLTFITSNIVDTHWVNSLPHPPFESLVGTNLVQLGWILTALRHLRRGVCILDPLIAAGSDDRGGYKLYSVFGTNLKRISEAWLVEPALVRIVINGTLQTFFPAFVYRSRLSTGEFADQSPDGVLKPLFRGNYRYYLFLYPLMKLPLRLAWFWLLMCRIANRLNRVAGNAMLR